MSMLIHEKFKSAKHKQPNNIALITNEEEISYSQLDNRSNIIAEKLLRLGIKPGDIVGVHMNRGIHLIATLLGVMKSGGCYLPLDPYYPNERLSYMVEHSETALIITDDDDQLDWLHGTQIILNINELDMQQTANPALPQINDDDLCYVMYTSGSTGKPKGVMISHRTVAHYLGWMQSRFTLTTDKRVLNQTTYSFDISVWEIFWPLTCGAGCALINEDEKYDPDLLAAFILRHHVNVVQFVPTALRIILDANVLKPCTSITDIFSGGEALPQKLVNDLAKQFKGKIHNLYGPTEATIFAYHWPCEPNQDDAIVPIGIPIPHAKGFIFDQQLRPVAKGQCGELYLGGDTLAKGYLKRNDLTEERFLAHPITGERMYRTGDLVSEKSDGTLLFHGRCDSQIKLRGHRIELAEIEVQLQSIEDISHAAVITVTSSCGDVTIKAFCVSASQQSLDIQAIRLSLSGVLPHYMRPTHYCQVDALPTLPNGKINKSILNHN